MFKASIEDRVLNHIRRFGPLRILSISESLGLSKMATENAIKRLQAKGKLEVERVTSDPYKYYSVKEE